MAEEEVKEDEEKKEGEEGAEGEDGEEGEGGGKKKKKPKLIIIIAGVLIIVAGVGAGLMFSGVLGGDKKEGDISLEESEMHKAKEEKFKPVYMDLPDIIVNLNSTGRRAHFINLKLTLELKSEKDMPLIEGQMPRIIDAFNTYLRELRKEDIQGSAGLYRLEHELLLRLQKTLTEGEVTDILFREIIVQ